MEHSSYPGPESPRGASVPLRRGGVEGCGKDSPRISQCIETDRIYDEWEYL